ncbi:cell division protein ZapE [Roseicitreum antarcticum]|uniref:Cell division protein ZapE n=1 Tax=Roseicitreum antarcticum TaxID=564137 RepID=A0A1H2VKH2_9RHOB|nr:cell division protein ZapE [Roseicitreum antarcticum]SDW68875.1 cell division protein ZapE [Roseicitreum antarcticum]
MTQTLTQIYDARVASGDLRPDPAQRSALPLLEALRQQLQAPQRKSGLRGLFAKAPPPPKGLYLWGGVGRGKSMLMDLFVAATDIPEKRRVHFHAFMQDIHAGMHAARARNVQDALAPVADAIIAETRLLAFDEMQITDITDAMIVGRLFQRLFDAGVVVVTTSNRPPKDLYLNGLNRVLFVPFIDLIAERMTVHELATDTDYRQHRLSGAQVYFHPADAVARAAVQAIWDDLTGGDPGLPLTLTLKGRKITLPHAHNGIARASFWDLCSQPLGPADYLAIARAVKVLILEDIPRLSMGNYNEAKRFVTLIDTLYEAKTRLIITAADRPEQIYTEGTGAFEFDRTVSRLQEMQSADWAAE